jgi:hypothetical protein
MLARLPAVPGPKLWRTAWLAGAAVLLVGGTAGLISTAAGATGGGVQQMHTNTGYKCDRNLDVGQSDPAHTNCQATSSGTLLSDASSGSPPPGGPGNRPPGGPGSHGSRSPSGGHGTRPPNGTSGTTTSVNHSTPGQPSQPGQGVDGASTQNGLATTGVPVRQMIGLALATLIGGIGLVVAGRDRRRSATG